MKAFICKLFHSSTQYSGGKYLRCRTCGRTWIAAHHVEAKPVQAKASVDRAAVELERMCGLR